MIIRNCDGQVMGTVKATKNLITNPFNEETYALMVAVYLCKEMGFQTIMLEGDALNYGNSVGNDIYYI